jgi:hypothetical protein
MKTTMKAYRAWINSLPDCEVSIEAVAHGSPLAAKRVIAYRENGGICIITNPMGTHLSDEFFSQADIVSIFNP